MSQHLEEMSGSKEGFVSVLGGKIWYKVFGAGKKTPLIIIHGGPGSTHYYLLPIKALSHDRPVIFYDQLGCGNSDRPDDPNLWVVDRFLDELETLVQALKLEKFYLLGQSWGSVLAAEYALAHPKKVAGIIFADPYLSSPLWIQDANRLKKTLPKKLQIIINVHENMGTTSSADYKKATKYYYKNFVNRLKIKPLEVKKANKESGRIVYLTMWGPTEFCLTGTLKDYDISPKLKQLKMPVLFVCGRYDEATPETTAQFQKMIPGSQLHIFEDSAHHPHLEETPEYLGVISSFLNTIP